MVGQNYILDVFALKTSVMIAKNSRFNLLKAKFYAALVSFRSSSSCVATHVQGACLGVWVFPSASPFVDTNFSVCE